MKEYQPAKKYILFIDTETSGLPKNWKLPYDAPGNWPFIVQVAWQIYSPEGEWVKTENHYIKDSDYQISQLSRQIHGISPELLNARGKERGQVMKILQQDLLHFQPLLVAHFMQLDLHMIGAGFFRAGLENPAPSLPCFCTMEASSKLLHASFHKYLKLGELYERLFNQSLQDQHNALTDTKATAACFFELKKRGDIDEAQIYQQQKQVEKKFPAKSLSNYLNKFLNKYFTWILLP